LIFFKEISDKKVMPKEFEHLQLFFFDTFIVFEMEQLLLGRWRLFGDQYSTKPFNWYYRNNLSVFNGLRIFCV